MPTKIKMRLCESDIRKAVKEVDEYWKKLQTKTKVFCGRLAEFGMTVASAKIGESPLGQYVSLNVKYSNPASSCKAILFATGQVKNTEYGQVYPLMMIEFGAGIHYNHDANPKAGQFGMGVGTFPGQTHAFQEEGWYYMDTDGKWHHSYGVKATMPMYSADTEMILNIRKIAKEVFSS